METGSRESVERAAQDGEVSSSQAAPEQMLEHQHTHAEQQLIEVEKLNDEAKFQEVFRKTFITEQKKGADSGELWTLHDM